MTADPLGPAAPPRPPTHVPVRIQPPTAPAYPPHPQAPPAQPWMHPVAEPHGAAEATARSARNQAIVLSALGTGFLVLALVGLLAPMPAQSLRTSQDGATIVQDSGTALQLGGFVALLGIGAFVGGFALLRGEDPWAFLGAGFAVVGAMGAFTILRTGAETLARSPVHDGYTVIQGPFLAAPLFPLAALVGAAILASQRRWPPTVAALHVAGVGLAASAFAIVGFALWAQDNAPALQAEARARAHTVPGFEVVALVAVVVGLALLARRKRR